MTLRVGQLVEVTVGPIANGGHCVARVGDDPAGRVIFVRHALPGERARVQITEDSGGRFCRGDAVEILTPAPERVPAPCPHAGPGRCGGCDWQHVQPAMQRRHKAQLIQELFHRFADLTVEVEVEELPGGALGWRTRTIYAYAEDGALGMRRHRSHSVEELVRCPLGVEAVADLTTLPMRPGGAPKATAVEVIAGEDGSRSVLIHRGKQPQLTEGPAVVRRQVLGAEFTTQAGGFWQVHPHAARTFATAILAATEPQPGEKVLDLYAGAGLFTRLCAQQVTAAGSVIGVEGNRRAAQDALANLASTPWARVAHDAVSARSVRRHGLGADVVILDPPRAGAGADVMRAVLALAPRVVAYLSCDPATLARDIAIARDEGWRMRLLRAFDAFPMTHHVECLAVLSDSRAK